MAKSGQPHDDWDRGGCLGGQSCRRAVGDNHIDLETNQVRKESRKPIILAIRPAVLDHKIPSLLIAEIAQTRAKGLRALGRLSAVGNPRNPIRKTFADSFCARVANGHAAAAPLTSLMNSRRLIASPEGQGIVAAQTSTF
jgi:hypothetical protein